VCLADHKILLGELSFEQQRPIEKYGKRVDGTMGWASLPWDTPVYAVPGQPILVRYQGVVQLENWEGYTAHMRI
jgi:hypothetical protein